MASFLESLFGLGQGDDTIAAAKNNEKLIKGLDTTGTGYLNEAKGITGDYLDLGKLGASRYADAMGLNGDEGYARATGAFHTNPGYEFALDQGLQALERTGSKYGRANSGQTDLDLMKYATGYADQAFGDWLDRLGGYNSMYTTGVGGATKSLGDLTSFKEGITQGLIDSNNQTAAGKEANGAGAGNLLGTVASIGGKFMGYGGF